jgi:hypothetical protein
VYRVAADSAVVAIACADGVDVLSFDGHLVRPLGLLQHGSPACVVGFDGDGVLISASEIGRVVVYDMAADPKDPSRWRQVYAVRDDSVERPISISVGSHTAVISSWRGSVAMFEAGNHHQWARRDPLCRDICRPADLPLTHPSLSKLFHRDGFVWVLHTTAKPAVLEIARADSGIKHRRIELTSGAAIRGLALVGNTLAVVVDDTGEITTVPL